MPRTEFTMNRDNVARRLRMHATSLRDLANEFDRFADDTGRENEPGWPLISEIVGEAIAAHVKWLSSAHLESALGWAVRADLAKQAGK
jgi:hypothetical protein